MARNQVMILGGVTLVAGVAVAIWLALSSREAPVAGPQSLIPQASAPGAAPAQAPVAANQAEAPQIVPTFDVVRISAEGEALVAGNARAGAAITLRVDGAPVAEVAADSAGQFVAMFALGFSDTAQELSLTMQDAEGRVVEAPDTVLLTPRPAPVAVAEAPVTEAPVADGAASAEATAEGPTTQGAGETAPQEVAADEGTAPLAEAAPADVATADVATAETTPTEVAPTEVATAEATPTEIAPTDAIPAEVARAEAAEAPLAAPAATAILMRGDGQIELLDRAPQVMDNVVIDAISYSDSGDVQISGRAASADPAANLRIYLDNRPVALAVAESGDWTLDLPSVDAGIYTLRVDQLNAAGGVVSRFETPFLRESPEALAQARRDSGQAPEPTQTASLESAAPQPEPPPPPRAQLITVQPGHTLWAISRDRYGLGERYMVIFDANRSQIRDPDLIYPGQVFALPDE